MANDLPDGNLKNLTMSNVVGKTAAINPALAATLMPNLPDSSQAAAANSIAQSWLVQNPQAAEQWVNTLQAGPARDAAVSQIINVEGPNDLPTAFNWAATVSNDGTRAALINRVVVQWARTDPAAAAQAVQNANVTDQQRANLLNTIQRLAPPQTN
jgi:hypothetical protein